MSKSISLSGIDALSDDELMDRIGAINDAVPNGEFDAIRDRLAKFEEKYGLTSSRMVTRLRSKEIRETTDICEWLLILKSLEQLPE